ncbi:MAG: tRNA (adenosine(37)-N6)-threonylcarbamoyltransferase complex ATPase subunit type 1 TsaE [Myxococcaceae bacterium]
MTTSPAETRRLGAALGALLRAGDFVGLSGGLGAGKTEFVRGVAEGAGVPLDQVASPTFAIVYPYAGRLPLYHADLYRLTNVRELYETGFFDMGDDGAFLVEWFERIPEAAPRERLVLAFRNEGDDTRRISADARGSRACELLRQWTVANPES